MQFSENWLREFVNPSLAAQELARLLTMAGLEVESLQSVAPPFDKVVVAQVLSVEKHPDADKLKLCRVDAGGSEPLQIVCGAPNVVAGMKVPCALVGARLPGIDIKAAKVRGVESFGMLCSARELGLSEDHGGLLALPADAPVGQDVRRYLDLDDQRFTLKLTPNRADCLGVYGIAREVAALTGATLRPLRIPSVPATVPDRLPVKVAAPDLCGRFSGRVIRGVNARAATPDWMRRRLERCGLRSISALVDISNYVMLELNRPNHVFDLARIKGGLEVRWARAGERLLLLNGQVIDLAPDVGVIADESGVESLAGIMGGETTAVSLETTDVYVEAAFWWPDAIQGRARRYGFTSDAGHRFERGVDFADTVAGVERVTRLILEICGGRAGPVDDQVLRLPERKPVRLRTARAAKILGIPISAEEIAAIFGRLGLAWERSGQDFLVTPPSYRFDLAIEEDLIEEIARLHGYDRIPVRVARASIPMLPRSESARSPWRLRRLLAARDYQEVVNYSFVDGQWEQDFCANRQPVVLANPIASQMGVMRSSLIGGLVGNLAHNLKRRVERVRVFEVGRCFLRDAKGDQIEGFLQPQRIGGLAYGTAAPEQWGIKPDRQVDFYDVKGDVEVLLEPFAATYERLEHPALHPGRAAQVLLAGVPVGLLGELHPRWVQKYELGTAPVVFELDLDALLRRELPRYAEVSRFPPVVRDLALVVAQTLPAEALLQGLRKAAPAVVRDIRLFDVYAGKGIEQEKKSLAFRVVMQDTEKTLSDGEVEAVLAKLIEAAQRNFAAKLRA
ncbi:MAG: phenylalanine--tRNA ligase subunit beta [Pseudomonadota bacterium]|jgi:phenylalanyl-tRNA synthetase beta chain